MTRPTLLHSRTSAVAPMARWGSGFPIVAGLRRELFQKFARAVWPASRDGHAKPCVRSPPSNLPLSHPASSLPPLPGSHAAGPVPPAGRTLFATARPARAGIGWLAGHARREGRALVGGSES